MVMTIKKGSDKAEIGRLIEKISSRKVEGIDAYKYCGVIKLNASPDEIQKQLRGEWD